MKRQHPTPTNNHRIVWDTSIVGGGGRGGEMGDGRDSWQASLSFWRDELASLLDDQAYALRYHTSTITSLDAIDQPIY